MDDIIVNQLKVYRSIFKNIKDYQIFMINPKSIRSLDTLLDNIYHVTELIQRHNLSKNINMIDYTYSIISQMCIQIIYKWIENGMNESPDDMTELLDKITKYALVQ